MHRYIQARLMSDFAQEFSLDLERAKPLERRPSASPEQPQTTSAQQLSFEFAMPDGR